MPKTAMEINLKRHKMSQAALNSYYKSFAPKYLGNCGKMYIYIYSHLDSLPSHNLFVFNIDECGKDRLIRQCPVNTLAVLVFSLSINLYAHIYSPQASNF